MTGKNLIDVPSKKLIDEKLHPFIAIRLYRGLTSVCGTHGAEIFRFATRLYGYQRGARMALRAIRDGVAPIGFAAYLAYMESSMPPSVLAVELTLNEGYIDDKITRCPWNDMWIEHDCLDCGRIFCSEIDKAVVRGMNTELDAELLEIMPDSGLCHLHLNEQGIDEGFFAEVKRLAGATKQPIHVTYEYLTANLWFTYGAVVSDTLGAEADGILSHVRAEVTEVYGPHLFKRIDSYAGTDFARVN